MLIVLFVLNRAYSIYSRGMFLSDLKGEIVFLDKNKKGHWGIYKISANGQNRQLLYQTNSNSSYPFAKFLEDGTKIYFRQFENDERAIYVMDADGSNVSTVKNFDHKLLSFDKSMCEDIIVEEGRIFYINQSGRKINVFTPAVYDSYMFTGAYAASWSPDRKYILFCAPASWWNYGIYMVNIKDAKVMKLTRGIFPHWVNFEKKLRDPQ